MTSTEVAQSTRAGSTAETAAAVRDLRKLALERVLASPAFRKNARLSTLLTYLCTRAADEGGEPPKEYTIATDVFRRGPDFDGSTDSIVRVEMHRLRKKLRDFYADEGKNDRWQIVLEAGCYRPHFSVREQEIEAPVLTVPALTTVVTPSETVPLLPFDAAKPLRNRFYLFVVAVAVTGCLLLAAFLYPRFSPRQEVGKSERATAVTIAPAILAADARDNVRILCGSSQGGNTGVSSEWGADRYFSGGSSLETQSLAVFRTRTPDLYRTARVGDFQYDIPLHPGPHELRLHFAERTRAGRKLPEGGENTRIFSVFANGAMLLEKYDIAADATLDTADVKVFRNIQPARDGKLHLQFIPLIDTPLINAIEILPGSGEHLEPIRLVTQPQQLSDKDGVRWSPDDFFLHGRTVYHGRAGRPSAGEISEPAIVDGERYGNFSYAIPVPAGRYTAKLHFYEVYWGPDLPGGGGVGNRIFNVYCNGEALWKNLDVYREAGARRELVKTATGLQPNAQGKIHLSFIPVKNYAMVSAIELLDEGGSAKH